MAKSVHRCLVSICVASGWLLLMTGCETGISPALPIDPSAPSTDLAMFMQDLAREALAALLF